MQRITPAIVGVARQRSEPGAGSRCGLSLSSSSTRFHPRKLRWPVWGIDFKVQDPIVVNHANQYIDRWRTLWIKLLTRSRPGQGTGAPMPTRRDQLHCQL